MKKIENIIHAVVRNAVVSQQADGSWAGGHNGMYGHPETPVRVTSHMLVLLSSYLKRQDDPVVRRAMDAAISFLLHDDRRPAGWNMVQRTDPKGVLDSCNGVIGAAWTVEGLISAYESTGRRDVLECAAQLVDIHPFDEKRRLWYRRDVSGAVLDFDRTLNHQVWFAAATAMLVHHGVTHLVPRLEMFLEGLGNLLGLYPDGIVRHATEYSIGGIFPRILTRWYYIYRSRAIHREKAIGYHLFNLYGLALIRKYHGDCFEFDERKLERAIAVVSGDWFQAHIRENAYAYPYNSPGWEAPFVSDVFGLDLSIAEDMAREQAVRLVNREGLIYDRLSEDGITSNARIYEIARSSDHWWGLPIDEDLSSVGQS